MVHVYVELSAAFSKTTDIPTEVDSDEYGYQSDSDLEDDWDLDDLRSPNANASTSAGGSRKGKVKYFESALYASIYDGLVWL